MQTMMLALQVACEFVEDLAWDRHKVLVRWRCEVRLLPIGQACALNQHTVVVGEQKSGAPAVGAEARLGAVLANDLIDFHDDECGLVKASSKSDGCDAKKTEHSGVCLWFGHCDDF